MKSLFIAEKPSVAREFANALGVSGGSSKGYLENENYIITWCVGHLVTMSYPEKYNISFKKWSLASLPFIPQEYLYEIIPSVKDQFKTVSGLLSRNDVTKIYVCTDSGREGEYIYRLVEMMSSSDVKNKERRRVWIDSQTEDEIKKGIANAKLLNEYDNLAASAYLRAKEDYLMGINFSRLMSLKYGTIINNLLNTKKYRAVSIGRVMTCVLGMVVRREREIRNFVKVPFFRIAADFSKDDSSFEGIWHATDGSKYKDSPLLYNDNGFKDKKTAEEFIEFLKSTDPFEGVVQSVARKNEKKNAPLLFNLAELQNECSKRFHISPDDTLNNVQNLYEKKLVTYPRTDARVLSTAIAGEISRNISGLKYYSPAVSFAEEILSNGYYKNIAKTKYTNDKQITDHYAIIPTGQGLNGLKSLPKLTQDIYHLIVSRFLAIFYPPAVYKKISAEVCIGKESFSASSRINIEKGYLKVAESFYKKDKNDDRESEKDSGKLQDNLKKGDILTVNNIVIKEGEKTPPKRYTSGSMILAMENAGQLIEDPELREHIKGSGIGTSATRAEILKKLVSIKYIKLNNKTQVITPELFGELVFDATELSIRAMLEPALTASWEKGLNYVAEGTISEDEYMDKLSAFINKHVVNVKYVNNQALLEAKYNQIKNYYKRPAKKSGTK